MMLRGTRGVAAAAAAAAAAGRARSVAIHRAACAPDRSTARPARRSGGLSAPRAITAAAAAAPRSGGSGGNNRSSGESAARVVLRRSGGLLAPQAITAGAATRGSSGESAARVVLRRAAAADGGGGEEHQHQHSASGSEGGVLRVHYLRRDENYAGWGLHAWGEVAEPTHWGRPLAPTGVDPTTRAPYWDLPLRVSAGHVGLLVYRVTASGEEQKAAGAEHVDPSKGQREVFLAGTEQRAYAEAPDMARVAAGTLFKSYAHWVSASTLVWRVPVSEDGELSSPQRRFVLHYSASAAMTVTGNGIEGADDAVPLRVAGLSVPPHVMAQYPHLFGATHLEVPQEHLGKVREWCRGQVALSVESHTGRVLDCTGVQLAGLLDDLFATDEPLGDHTPATPSSKDPNDRVVSVWAPTAQKVELLRWSALRGGGPPEVHAMTRGSKGVWSAPRPAAWLGGAYRFRVAVFCPWTNRIETVEATDPYSRCTTANGERSIFVDLDAAPELMPPGWREHHAPKLAHWTDVSVYELHVRDFSACDASVPQHLRGKYLAFDPSALYPEQEEEQPSRLSDGLAHLKRLVEAGLNHVHLLPTYDFGSVPERPEEQAVVTDDLSRYAPDGEQQQQAVAAVADRDAYNWGYDPVHYGVPEGSYSTNPDGPARVVEFRRMVQALHGLGLRVVLDVVYNHTFASGPYSAASVLDKVVPGYYHRRAEDGDVCHSTCCNNTASEHRMFERLMVDDLVHWARHYRVDGFRFDIMGHHFVSNMTAVRSALNALTPEKDGVDGRHIYVYGEAWDFGEVALNQRGRNASQHNLGGSRIGAFNDRMRDGVMGGSPYSPLDAQGFATGLATDPNGAPHQGSAQEQLATLLHRTDWVRFALAGNLKDFEMQVADGRLLCGQQDVYHGNQPLAYCCDPCENVAYVGCHDNETLFDQVALKAPLHVDADGRARMCGLAQALVLLSQGVPFIHAGDDLLRSKSLDRDSYNSGDHFNRIDWTGRDNNFGVGLPPASKNGAAWPVKRPLLAACERYKPSAAVIARQAAYFRALLRVRYSSPLFRMPTAEHVRQQLRFHNTGPQQVPGVIVLQLLSSPQPDHGTHDAAFESVVAVFNARPEPHELAFPPLLAAANGDDAEGEGGNGGGDDESGGDNAYELELHPALAALADDPVVQLCSADNARRRLTVSPRMAAVFVQRRRR